MERPASFDFRTASNQASNTKKDSNVSTLTVENDDDGYEYLSFNEVKNTIDLIVLYIDINSKVIETKKVNKRF